MKMKLVTAFVLVASTLVFLASVSAAPRVVEVNDVPYQRVVARMASLTPDQVDQLDAIDIRPFTIPEPGVEVMRVRLEETYEVAGIGQDTVELTGWIAVRHGEARPIKGRVAHWNDFEMDTQFVALELQGESEIFGPVKVSLDESRPAYGKVGSWVEMPEKARVMLASDPGGSSADCSAGVNVSVSMPQLGLDMTTDEPALWHSQVTTVPPVGQQASVTVEPVSMSNGEREVATLLSGKIKFREVVDTTASSLLVASR